MIWNAFDWLQANRNNSTFYAWNRMQLEEQLIWMTLYLFQFNRESKETIVSITWNRMQLIDLNLLGMTLYFIWNAIDWLEIRRIPHSIQIQLWTKNTLASIEFQYRIWIGIIDKLFKLKLKSLGNQKKHWYGIGSNWSLQEQLMWNDIKNSFIVNQIN